jgi:hypothetical protein
MTDMSLKYSNYSKRNAMAAAIMVICTFAIYNWFISPHTQYLHAAQKYLTVIDSEEKRSESINNELKQQQKRLDELTHQLELQKQSFFNNDQAKIFLSDLQSIAEKSGCLVANLKFLPARDITVKSNNSLGICHYQTNMSVMGNYEDIVKFLNTLQNRTAKVWIDSIYVGMKQTTNGYLSCDITLSIYTLKVKENTSVKDK